MGRHPGPWGPTTDLENRQRVFGTGSPGVQKARACNSWPLVAEMARKEHIGEELHLCKCKAEERVASLRSEQSLLKQRKKTKQLLNLADVQFKGMAGPYFHQFQITEKKLCRSQYCSDKSHLITKRCLINILHTSLSQILFEEKKSCPENICTLRKRTLMLTVTTF